MPDLDLDELRARAERAEDVKWLHDQLGEWLDGQDGGRGE